MSHQDNIPSPKVHCDVTNCVYHDPDCICTADKINVGPSFAVTSSETICATFQDKE